MKQVSREAELLPLRTLLRDGLLLTSAFRPLKWARRSPLSAWLLSLSCTYAALHIVCATWLLKGHSPLQLASHLRSTLYVCSVEWTLYAAFWIWALRSPPSKERLSMGLLIGSLVLSRVSWWGSPPSPSEDVWRYLWDGQRALFGLPIYSVAPQVAHQSLSSLNESSLESIQTFTALYPYIGHAEVPTVYPPGAQLLFELSARLNRLWAGGITGALLWWRGLLLIADLSLLMTFKKISERLGLESRALVGYLLCPLVAFESSLSAHLDLFGVMLMVWSLAFALEAKWWRSGMLLGLSVSVKLVPIILSLAYLIAALTAPNERSTRPPFASALKMIGASVISAGASYLYFYQELSALGWVWPGLKTYATHWSFNGSIYPILEAILRYLDPQNPTLRETLKVASAAGLWALGGWMMIGGTGSARRVRRRSRLYSLTPSPSLLESERSLGAHISVPSVPPLLSTSLITILGFLFLSPVVYPWYLLWVIPLAYLVYTPHLSTPQLTPLSHVVVVWGAISLCTYLPRIDYLIDNTWHFNILWSLWEYGTLGLTFVIMKRYTHRSR